LEAYAQRDPLVAYKGKAFGMFQELSVNIRSGVVARAFTYRPRPANEAPPPRSGGGQAAISPPAGNGGGPAPAGPPPEAANMGRNEPCWCGSGKKYKDCHYARDHAGDTAAPAATAQSGAPAIAAVTNAAANADNGAGGKRRRRKR